MDTTQWPQEGVVKPAEDIVTSTCSKTQQSTDKKAKPQKDHALNCPRCNSTNTKFCYYNNYSLTQPRYFCKTCRRYWTEGGSLRNIPVGGGSRKNKRSSSATSSSKKLPHDDNTPTRNPRIPDGQDLNIAFSGSSRSFSEFIQVPNIHGKSKNHCSPLSSNASALEFFTGIPPRGLNPLMPNPVHDPDTGYGSGFSIQDFKPTLSFSLESLGSGYDSLQTVHDSSRGRLLFPFEDVKQQVANTADNMEQGKENNGDPAGFWAGMLSGGSW